jgi:hypothetical protein
VPNDTKNDTPSAEDKVARLETMVTAVMSKIEKLGADTSNGLSGLRSMYDSQLSKLRTQIAQARGDGSYDKPYNRDADAADERNSGRDFDPFMEQDRFERGRDRFERTNKLYSTNPEIKKRVDALMSDKNDAAGVLVERGGRIDYERSYRTAYLIVRDQIAEEAEIAAATARAQADEDKSRTKADATLSGDSAEDLPEGLTLDDISGMSADQMVKKGLVPGVKRHKPLVGV